MSITVTAADVNKLRQQTGAGMMDCRKALTESGGDFEKAIDYLRAKGQKVAANRSDRDAKEGVVIAKANPDGNYGIILNLSAETDFVSKNEDFMNFGLEVAELALQNMCSDIDAIKALPAWAHPYEMTTPTATGFWLAARKLTRMEKKENRAVMTNQGW